MKIFQSMLKEEKLIIASNQWGSLFTDDFDNGSESDSHPINTFWGDIVRCYSRLAIPLIDYISGKKNLSFAFKLYAILILLVIYIIASKKF